MWLVVIDMRSGTQIWQLVKVWWGNLPGESPLIPKDPCKCMGTCCRWGVFTRHIEARQLFTQRHPSIHDLSLTCSHVPGYDQLYQYQQVSSWRQGEDRISEDSVKGNVISLFTWSWDSPGLLCYQLTIEISGRNERRVCCNHGDKTSSIFLVLANRIRQ